MIWSSVETLKFIEPHLPCNLVPPSAFANIMITAGKLPLAMSAYYLECRLRAGASQVDFFTCTTACHGGREVLARYDPITGLARHRPNDPVWRRVHDFSRQWASPASPLYEQVSLVWLEFDRADTPSSSLAAPSLLFCLDPELLKRPSSLQRLYHLNPQTCQQVAEQALACLFARPLPARTKQNLLTCFNALPPGGQIIHIGAMLARQTLALNLYGFIPTDQVLAYLARIGWPGSSDVVETMLATFCRSTDMVRLDWVVDDTISPRIGMEFSIDPAAEKESGQRFILDECVEHGLCTVEKKEALLAWSGSARELFSRQAWPTRLRRWLGIKIAHRPDQPLEAKAYLGFMPQFSLF